MKRLVLSALAALSLAACATPTVYQRASSPSAVGYSEYRIEPGRYRVVFRGGSNSSPGQVMDFALIRAAELALADGYDWFRVSDRYIQAVGGGYYGPQLSFGIGGASFGHHSATGGGVSSAVDLGGGGQELEATIEVVMGRGPKPEGGDVYDARSVRAMRSGPA